MMLRDPFGLYSLISQHQPRIVYVLVQKLLNSGSHSLIMVVYAASCAQCAWLVEMWHSMHEENSVPESCPDTGPESALESHPGSVPESDK